MSRMLSHLLNSHEYLRASLSFAHSLEGLAITGISSCSSACAPGFLFVAKPGATPSSRDGHDFIDDALSRGASAVVVGERACRRSLPVPVISAQHCAQALSYLCEAFFEFPSTKLKLIGLTGTNGKTSTSFMLHSIFKAAGFNPKVIGTLGIGDPGALTPLSHTTMEAEFLSHRLYELARAGVSHVILETSSHGLALDRVTALDFSAVGLSNITQDHLDFHGSMTSYILAKQKLFDHIAKDHTYKLLPKKNSFAKSVQVLPRTYHYDPDLKPEGLALPGEFQIHNASLASAIALSLGIEPEFVALGLSQCKPIPGRLEPIINKRCKLFVDYAHTPDALEATLKSVRKLTKGRVILVFGAGGERDQGKRPFMGRVAHSFADVLYITDDNPRFEDPQAIRSEIMAGIGTHSGEVHELACRSQAIKTAIMSAGPDDLVLIAGKGHENYQIYGNEHRSFCDQSVARQIVESL